MVTRKRNSVSKQKRRKIKIKTQRGGMFYKCLDHNGNMVKKWMPCRYSRLDRYEKKQEEAHKESTSGNESKSNTRKKNTSPLRGTLVQRFDTFMQGPQYQKDTIKFLTFLQGLSCCEEFEDNIIKKYFNPISERNLSILRNIVKHTTLTRIVEGNSSQDASEKQKILQKLLGKLEYMQKHFEKHIKKKYSQYENFLKSIEDFPCSEDDCKDFGKYLNDMILKNPFYLELLEYIQFSHKFSDDRKNFIIKHIWNGKREFYKDSTPKLVESIDLSKFTFPIPPK